jgi:hypothetical protein
MGHKVEGYGMKLERVSNRLRMQDTRAQRPARGGLAPEEEEILRDLRNGEAEVISTRGDPFGNH